MPFEADTSSGECARLFRRGGFSGLGESVAVQIDLTGRTAVVTGGSRGIGAGIVKALAAAGATVAALYRQDKAGGPCSRRAGRGGRRPGLV